ncbi:MAG: recombination protein O N-terminal domain-containing protein [Bacteroidota bacterium]
MLFKTRGIAINFIKYKETSIIAHIFTETYGIQSYIINGIRSSRSKQKISSFQPLTLLDLVVYKHPQKEINRISEYRIGYVSTSTPYHHHKSFIAIFLSEVLKKILTEDTEANILFAFIHNSVIELDKLNSNIQNFHLQFLVKLSSLLGLSIPDFFNSSSTENQILSEQELLIQQFSTQDYSNDLRVSNDQRRVLLSKIIDFYSFHLVNLKNLKSLSVLKEVLS